MRHWAIIMATLDQRSVLAGLRPCLDLKLMKQHVLKVEWRSRVTLLGQIYRSQSYIIL